MVRDDLIYHPTYTLQSQASVLADAAKVCFWVTLSIEEMFVWPLLVPSHLGMVAAHLRDKFAQAQGSSPSQESWRWETNVVVSLRCCARTTSWPWSKSLISFLFSSSQMISWLCRLNVLLYLLLLFLYTPIGYLRRQVETQMDSLGVCATHTCIFFLICCVPSLLRYEHSENPFPTNSLESIRSFDD